MTNNEGVVPVGLNNIGNTCYFNSVLQYYYTLLPFRDTMINNEEHVENENSEPKKIGGIEVDQSEILRAKKFVGLLKELFLNLQQTQEKAISPQYDLAYMALLNEKDDDIPVSETTTNTVTDDETHIVPTSDNIILQDQDSEMTEVVDDVSTATKIEDNFDKLNETVCPDVPPPNYHDVISKDELKKRPVPPIPVNKTKERPSVDAMMFGKQQDVTECMGNVMYLVEAALKPLSKTEDGEQVDDMIRQLFYGKARQIISYCDNTTLETVKKEMEEDFSHVIVDAAEGKDLYDGLDEYFFADKLENFQGGHEAIREVTVKSFPPILQVLVQRVQFDRATANVYKSNAFIQFDKTIYLDRYIDSNFEELKEYRVQVGKWRNDLDQYKKQVDKYMKSDTCNMPIPNLLNTTRQVLESYESDIPQEEKEQYQIVIDLLKKEADEKKKIIDEGTEKMKELKDKIKNQYNEHNKLEYKLHAVFVHQGQANYGHYWIYILDHKQDQWWKYNDSLVTKAQESEIFHDTTGSTANPYFLVYVDASKINDITESITVRLPTVISDN